MVQEYITSRQNPLMVQTVKVFSSRKHRRTLGLYGADGTKLLEEALKWAPEQLRTVIFQEDRNLPPLPEHVRRVAIPKGLMEQISVMEAPEGVLFLMKLPEVQQGVVRPGTLILDGIQDPGNIGTILRTADALDVPVLLGEGCADPYNPKTVRATMGAVFRTPPGKITTEYLVRQCHEKGIPLVTAAMTPDASDIRKTDITGSAVVIGSEGQGVSCSLLEASDRQLVIPMHPRCESLNAAIAAALVLWQMTMK